MRGIGLRPGEEVPATVPYWVHHYQHRLPHLAIVLQGSKFPSCRRCGDRVLFRMATEAGVGTPSMIEGDMDFQNSAALASGL